MEIPSGATATLTLTGWACPRWRWFNLFPHRFKEAKARQVQALVSALELDGILLEPMELCQTPFITAVRIVETKVEV